MQLDVRMITDRRSVLDHRIASRMLAEVPEC